MKTKRIKTGREKGGEKKKYSYIKKRLAVNGFYAAGTAAASLLLFVFSMYLGIKTDGHSGINTGAMGVSCMLMALMSLRFSFISRKETGKNYIMSIISAAVSAAMLLIWALLIAAGMGV